MQVKISEKESRGKKSHFVESLRQSSLLQVFGFQSLRLRSN